MTTLTRRAALAAACSAAASPWITPVALASAPGEGRLVVIVLRGAMDGLDAVRPEFEPGIGALRPAEEGRAALGDWSLHPALAPVAAGLSAVHAVSTPYRGGRSHFDGQDLLEAGTAREGAARGGWLGRLAGVMPGAELETVYAVGAGAPLIVAGGPPVAVWDPGREFALPEHTRLLMELVQRTDPLFAAAAGQAMDIAERAGGEGAGRGPASAAAFAAARLREETRVATFSIGGWDTHAAQRRELRRPMRALAEAVAALRDGLGPVWESTAVVALTEFGRTVRMNGTGGTDHGTGGAMLLSGGAVRAGRVWGAWPGLEEAALYERRDLMPTSDARAHVAALMRALLPVLEADLRATVFPGLDRIGDAPLTL